jgi:hypothetical protein
MTALSHYVERLEEDPLYRACFGRGERTEVGQDTFGRCARDVAEEAFDEEQ